MKSLFRIVLEDLRTRPMSYANLLFACSFLIIGIFVLVKFVLAFASAV